MSVAQATLSLLGVERRVGPSGSVSSRSTPSFEDGPLVGVRMRFTLPDRERVTQVERDAQQWCERGPSDEAARGADAGAEVRPRQMLIT